MTAPQPNRRQFLATQTALATAACALPWATWAQDRRFEPQVGPWRRFQLNTKIEIPDTQGITRLWLPIPDLDTEYQQTTQHVWSGNASTARLAADPKTGVRMLYAEFAESTRQPTLHLTSYLQTRSRAVEWGRKIAAQEEAALLQEALKATELLPTDGIVRQTALQATRGAATDLDKVRAIYDWVITNAHREPKTRGCGAGDIKAMLESGDLGGKCADLNAIFVGMCRSVGVPARDVYGLRLAPSAFGYKELGANSANLKGAQHCRAEVYLKGYGWVAMDPADVLKVMRQETAEWIKDARHPLVAPVYKNLFGRWEGNWVGWNTGHDLHLPHTRAQGTLPFFMYPIGENASGRFDELSPDTFKYTMNAQELTT